MKSYLKKVITYLVWKFKEVEREHEWALQRAREWGMEDEYWAAIRDGCTPLEALEEWDLL